MTNTLELVPTKSVSDQIAKHVRIFLRKFVHQFFTDPDKPSGLDYAKARKVLKISQGYLSDLMHDKKSPSLNVVLGLRDATGASFEDITGHRPPLRPQYPMSLLPSSRDLVEGAIEEGLQNERPSGSAPVQAPPVRPTRR